MLRFLEGGGECAGLIAARDWTETPLGPPEQWGAVLKTTVATMLASRFPQALFWGQEGTLLYNDGYAPLMGAKEAPMGRPLARVWADVWDDIKPLFDRAMAGEASFIEDFELTTTRNGHPEQAWFTFGYSPVRDEFGKVVAVLDTVVETTETVLAKRRNELLNRELAHRMKNTFSVINAISSQTFGSDHGEGSPQQRFAERLDALAAAQDLLLGGNWGRVELNQLLASTLSPHLPHDEAVSIEGPPLSLAGKQVFGLALAIHELATNAVKYGAFAQPDGSVALEWQAGRPGSDDPFILTWTERGVGPVEKPKRVGFGKRLIMRALPMEFGGESKIDYGEDGIRFTLTSTMKSIKA